MLTGQILYPPPFRTEGTLRTTTIAFVPTIPFHTRALRGNFILGSTLCHIMSHPETAPAIWMKQDYFVSQLPPPEVGGLHPNKTQRGQVPILVR